MCLAWGSEDGRQRHIEQNNWILNWGDEDKGIGDGGHCSHGRWAYVCGGHSMVWHGRQGEGWVTH